LSDERDILLINNPAYNNILIKKGLQGLILTNFIGWDDGEDWNEGNVYFNRKAFAETKLVIIIISNTVLYSDLEWYYYYK
jgi:hypothetical protein